MSEHDTKPKSGETAMAGKNPQDLEFGQLNYVKIPSFSPQYSGDHGNFINSLQQMASDFYLPNSFKDTGPYKGYVLRVEAPAASTSDGDEEPEQSTDWSDQIDDGGAIRWKVRVRVPEVHAMLPVPKTVGDAATPEDKKIIDMYDIFPAQYLDMEKPADNEIVWVDWLQKSGHDWSEPMYINKLNAKFPGSNPNAQGGKGAHNKACRDKYNRKPPSGDTMAGKNKSLQPHQGLPRLSKLDLKMGTRGEKPNKVIPPADEFKQWKTGKDATLLFPAWKKILKEYSKYLMMGYFGHVKGNGDEDSSIKGGKRGTIISAPWYFDPTQPWELIYWVHGQQGFFGPAFVSLTKQMNELQAAQRNFILVMPQFMWSHDGTSHKGSGADNIPKGCESPHNPDTSGWHSTAAKSTWGGDLVVYHKNIMKVISDSIVSLKKADAGAKYDSAKAPAMISMFAHANGGTALARAAYEGALTEIKPDRIFFSDADLGDIKDKEKIGGFSSNAVIVWDKYVKNSKKKIWMTMQTSKTNLGTACKAQAKIFFDKYPPALLKKHYIYQIDTQKGHSADSLNALNAIHDDHAKLMAKAAEPEKTSEAQDPEKAENADAKAAAEDAKNKKEGKTTKADPPVPPKTNNDAAAAKPDINKDTAPATAASTQPKTSATEAAPKPDWSLEPAVNWHKTKAQNRVRVKHYGNIPKSDDKRLVPVNHDGSKYSKVKAHVLVVARYKAMREAAMKDGITQMNVVSAWRAHKWKSKQAYYAILDAKYGKGRGRGIVAFNSPHETGLAIDIVGHGLNTTSGGQIPKGMPKAEWTSAKASASKKKQYAKHKASKLGKWLIGNAHKFGFTPLSIEMWHWECRIPIENWESGKEFVEGKNYAQRVKYKGEPPTRGTTASSGGKSTAGTSGPSGGSGGGPCITNGGGGTDGTPGGGAQGDGVPGATKGGWTQNDAGTGWYKLNAKGKKSKFKPNKWPKDWKQTGRVIPQGLGGRLKQHPPGGSAAPGGPQYGKHLRQLTGFCIHETGGWPNSIAGRKYGQYAGSSCNIQFWVTSEGYISQCNSATNWVGQCQGASGHSVGIEMCVQGPMMAKYAKSAKKYIETGHHMIGMKKGNCDILTNKDKRVGGPIGMTGYFLPSPAQCNWTWKLIVALSKLRGMGDNRQHMADSKKYGNKQPQTKLALELKFPAAINVGGMYICAKWANGKHFANPAKSGSAWWLKHSPKGTAPPGIFCHHNISSHADGHFGVYYCMARGKLGYSHAKAYYATVGAWTMGEKVSVSGGQAIGVPWPSSAMVAMGQKKFPKPWMTAKCYQSVPGAYNSKQFKKKHKTRIKWDELVAANPKWIGDPTNPT